MTEDKQYQLNELNASDILSYLVNRVFSMEEHIRREKKQFANLKKESNRLFLEGAKRVEDIEKENTELKEEMEAKQVVPNDFKSRVETVTDRFNRKSSQLTKAKKHLEDVYKIAKGDWNDPKWHDQVLRKAEQFLKEVE